MAIEFVDLLNLKMLNSHSYVSLPEGTLTFYGLKVGTLPPAVPGATSLAVALCCRNRLSWSSHDFGNPIIKFVIFCWSFEVSCFDNTYTGWWYTYPSENYESQLG
jgi:hypothetical protein